MKHKTTEALTTITTEQGSFSAIAAAYSVDRVGDRIIPGAFEKTIEAWNQSGKRIPLHWDHESSAESIIGYVDPASMRETDQGLYVEGQLDLEHSEIAREAWRSMKNNAMALSFGYLAEETKAADGVNDLTSIDLFEISVVPGPANPDTRFLSLKSVEAAVAKLRESGVELPGWLDRPLSDIPPMTKEAVERVYPSSANEGDEEPKEAKPSSEEPSEVKSAPDDSLQRESMEVAIKNATEGFPSHRPEPEPEPERPSLSELERKSYEAVLKMADLS